MKISKNLFKTLFILGIALVSSFVNPPLPKYKDPKLPLNVRVEDLISRMSLDEKIAQTQCYWSQKTKLYENGDFSYAKAKTVLPHGLGQIARPNEGNKSFSTTGTSFKAKETAEWTNKIQKYFVEQTRLGIPVLFHEESLHGNQATDATSFPTPLALSSSWNEDLMTEVYSNIAQEVRYRGGHEVLAPVLDITQDPRWGRSEETLGEDPYLIGRLGVKIVNAYQGNPNKIDQEHVAATLKHFGVHGQPEGGSNIGPVFADERTLRTVFFKPFETVIKEAMPLCLMPCYSEIRSEPVHGSKWLLRDLLRKDWGFNGVIVSDYEAVKHLKELHYVEPDAINAAARAFNAGVDIETPDPYGFTELKAAIEQGKVSIATLNESVRRILTLKFKLGLFENPYSDPEKADAKVGNAQMRALALKAARQSITLLKNEGNILPLDRKKVKTVAVIGPNADKCVLGGYADEPKQRVTPLQALKEKYGSDVNFLYAEGTRLTDAGDWFSVSSKLSSEKDNLPRIAEAVEIAKKADVVLLMLGGNEAIYREAWAFDHLGDVTNLELMGTQNQLVNEISALGKPTAAFVFSGPPLSIVNLSQKVTAIAYGFYLGQETGYAVAETVFGDNVPSGKLSISFPRSAAHIPAYYYHKPSARRGYHFDDISPLYSFGYGLSYTTFQYSDLKIDKSSMTSQSTATVSINVKNTGNFDAYETVQLYVRDKVSKLTRPVKELKDFKKIFLKKGETQSLTFKIDRSKLEYYDFNMKLIVEPGDFEIMLGPSSTKTESVNLKITQ
jgi:beta-glucosidase